MTDYEKLLDEAHAAGADVIERYDFSNTRLKGLYCDGSVALSSDLRTEAEKKSILLEELGHHLMTVGDILDPCLISNSKQEHKARLWAFDKSVGVSGIIRAYKAGCRDKYGMSECLGITEQFLQEALEAYHQKYGQYVISDNYVIFFDPLGVLE